MLNGWSFSNDVEKKARWTSTMEWAARNGCGELVRISGDEFYSVDNPSSYTIGPVGGPMYREWDYESKERPSDELIEYSLAFLCDHWTEVAGEELYRVTWPSHFSGAKLRCLIVRALLDAEAPWGGWAYRSDAELKRREFTKFRSAINRAISPHEVDHVQFTVVDDEGQFAAADA